MTWLDGGNNTKLSKARNIARMHHFQMLNTMSAVAHAIGVLHRLIGINRAPHPRITNRMHRDLKAEAVRLDTSRHKVLLRKDFIAHVPARSHLSGIRLKHEGCATLNHTVDKHLQMRGAHHIALKARAHRRRFRRNPLNRVCAFKVKRHFATAQESPLGLKLAQ